MGGRTFDLKTDMMPQDTRTITGVLCSAGDSREDKCFVSCERSADNRTGWSIHLTINGHSITDDSIVIRLAVFSSFPSS